MPGSKALVAPFPHLNYNPPSLFKKKNISIVNGQTPLSANMLLRSRVLVRTDLHQISQKYVLALHQQYWLENVRERKDMPVAL